ncbi:MAG: hypothetical protein ACRD82_23100, partial [Blastocatellia bacterium]
AGLDQVVTAGGPTAPSAFDRPSESFTAQQARIARIVATTIERGQTGNVLIELDARGSENAFGFSLSFDASQLQFVSALLGPDAANASLNVNSIQAANGRLGFVLALPAGQAFTASTKQILVLSFRAAATGNLASTSLSFGDQPVFRELSDVNALILPVTFSGGAVSLTRSVASVSAASFVGTNLAAEAIIAAFGGNLATTIQISNGLPLPTQLAGTTVKVKDGAGVERLAPLFFVAPTQINYLVPAGTAAGNATITITSGDGTISIGQTTISSVAPGLFSANASGQGIAAATVLRIKADATQSFEPVSRFDSAQGKVVPVPIDLGPDLGNASDQVFLLLFGSGCRQVSSLANAQTQIGGVPVETLYIGPQGDFVGLDQINLRLTRSFVGRGEVQVRFVADGKAANIVTVSIK